MRFTRGEVEVVSEPLRVGAYGLVVEVHASLISAGTDRARLERRGAPHTPRAWAVGRIARAGPAAKAIRPDLPVGARVLVRADHTDLAGVDVTRDVAVRLPEHGNDESALLAGEATVALHALDRGGVPPRRDVRVIGLGLVGQLAVRLARRRGAQVSATGRHAARRELAMAESGGPAEVTVVACADPRAVREAVEGSRDGGRVVCVGIPSAPVSLDLADHLVRRQVDLIGAHTRFMDREARAAAVTSALEQGWAPLETRGLITHRIPGMDAARAYAVVCRPSEGVGVILANRQ